jgi:hypothetical protein
MKCVGLNPNERSPNLVRNELAGQLHTVIAQ